MMIRWTTSTVILILINLGTSCKKLQKSVTETSSSEATYVVGSFNVDNAIIKKIFSDKTKIKVFSSDLLTNECAKLGPSSYEDCSDQDESLYSCYFILEDLHNPKNTKSFSSKDQGLCQSRTKLLQAVCKSPMDHTTGKLACITD